MTYQGIVEKIINDLHTELGITCRVTIATLQEFEEAQMRCKKPKNISTYNEINKLFIGKTFIDASKRSNSRLIKRVRLTVPFIGKVK
jgi:hypothetical protein